MSLSQLAMRRVNLSQIPRFTNVMASPIFQQHSSITTPLKSKFVRSLSTGIKVDEGDPTGEQFEAPYLKLYALGTPNGQKIPVYLHLLGLKYHYTKINIMENTQKEDWYVKLNPNGKIPTLVDVNEKGEIYPVMETAAILLYLGEKYDTSRKYYYGLNDGKLYWDQIQWLTFTVASHAPLQGQANHFVKFAKEDIPYAKKRYLDEVHRVFGVYEKRLLENNGWLVGDHLNIADISAFGWIRKGSGLIGIDLATEYPAIKKWVEALDAIPEVREGLDSVGAL